jgi:phage FluMu protein Com
MKRASAGQFVPEPELNPVPATQTHKAEEVRCHCGGLLAKITAKGIEIKCRRCKRVRVIAFFMTPSPRSGRNKGLS